MPQVSGQVRSTDGRFMKAVFDVDSLQVTTSGEFVTKGVQPFITRLATLTYPTADQLRGGMGVRVIFTPATSIKMEFETGAVLTGILGAAVGGELIANANVVWSHTAHAEDENM